MAYRRIEPTTNTLLRSILEALAAIASVFCKGRLTGEDFLPERPRREPRAPQTEQQQVEKIKAVFGGRLRIIDHTQAS